MTERHVVTATIITTEGVQKRKYFSRKTAKEARQARKKFLSGYYGFSREKSVITVSQYAKEWVKTFKPNLTCNVRIDCEYRIKKMVESFGKRGISRVSALDCQRYLNGYAGLSASTIHKHAIILREFFKTAVNNGYIKKSPCDDLRMPSGEKGSHVYVSEANQRVIVDNWETHEIGWLAALMLLEGLRKGEGLAIALESLMGRTIDVKQAVRFENDKPLLVTPKTKTSVRRVPIFNTVRNIGLLEYISQRDQSECTKMTQTVFRRKWAKYNEFLRGKGCTQRVQCHDLRHTFTTNMCAAGVNPKVLQKWLGHASVTMTLDIYAHCTDSMEQAELLKLNEKFLDN